MHSKNTPIKYFAYLRKSSENKEKQALSIPAQKDKLLEMFGDLDIEFIEEERSAFNPHNRPKLTDMLERIRKGDRQGLIAWHPDRLSRNEVDASTLTYMIRTGEIQDLKLATYHFENSPEGIWMLQMALSQSQYESAKKGRDVKRGMNKKARMGIYPGPAPTGYVNDKFAERGNKTILKDADRFDLCRQMVDLMLTGEYTPPRILNIANNAWGFRTLNGKKLSRSGIYYLFTRPFYYGEFEYPAGSGNWYQGIHEPLMTRDEYDRIQVLLGRTNSPRPKKHTFAYRGPIICGECGAMVTAEGKVKRQQNGNIHHYVYYHCTKRKNPNCYQPAIVEKELEKQIAAELAKIEIPAAFKKWALARLKEMNAKQTETREHIYSSQRREYEACVRKIDNLIEMRVNNELTEDEFRTRKHNLLHEKDRLQALLNDTDQHIDDWLDVLERGFNFAETAAAMFTNARAQNDFEAKKAIFTALGSNLTLKDKKLFVSWDKLLFPIKTMAEEVRAIHGRLEPSKSIEDKRDLSDLYAQSPRLLGALDDVRTSIPKNKAFWIKFDGLEKIKFGGTRLCSVGPGCG